MNKTLILITVLLLVLPLEASAYKERKGQKGPQNEFRQAVKSRVTDHHQQQMAENKDFRKSLKNSDLSQDQRIATIKDHRETQHEENLAFQEQIHKERMDHLSDKFAKNEKLTAEQKQSILNRHETQYEESLAFREQQNSESIRAMEQILGDENLSPEERQTQMKEYRAAQKEENQEYRKARREENQNFRKSIHPEE